MTCHLNLKPHQTAADILPLVPPGKEIRKVRDADLKAKIKATIGNLGSIVLLNDSPTEDK